MPSADKDESDSLAGAIPQPLPYLFRPSVNTYLTKPALIFKAAISLPATLFSTLILYKSC